METRRQSGNNPEKYGKKLKSGKNPEAGRDPEKLAKYGIFPENPEDLATLELMHIIIYWFFHDFLIYKKK